MRTNAGRSLSLGVSAAAMDGRDAARVRNGPLFQGPARRRDARLLVCGVAATVAFVVLRAAGVYGEPNPWQVQGRAIATLIDFLNVTKYPPSLLFMLMTLGPAAIVCASADRVPEAVKQPLIVFGRAPFAFYVAHLYLHAHARRGIRGHAGLRCPCVPDIQLLLPQGIRRRTARCLRRLGAGRRALYPLCRWVAAAKERRQDWWLSYL